MTRTGLEYPTQRPFGCATPRTMALDTGSAYPTTTPFGCATVRSITPDTGSAYPTTTPFGCATVRSSTIQAPAFTGCSGTRLNAHDQSQGCYAARKGIGSPIPGGGGLVVRITGQVWPITT